MGQQVVVHLRGTCAADAKCLDACRLLGGLYDAMHTMWGSIEQKSFDIGLNFYPATAYATRQCNIAARLYSVRVALHAAMHDTRLHVVGQGSMFMFAQKLGKLSPQHLLAVNAPLLDSKPWPPCRCCPRCCPHRYALRLQVCARAVLARWKQATELRA